MEAALPNYDSPLRRLNAAEWAQAAWGPPLTDFYEALRLVCISFEDDEDAAALLLHVSVGDTHVGRGVGPRKALAKEQAAALALRALAREPPRDL